MRSFKCIAAIVLILISCTDNKSSNLTIVKESPNSETINWLPIDKKNVSKIKLLIADTTSVRNPEDDKLLLLKSSENGISFVDTTGTPILKPVQIISFVDDAKNELIDIFNSYLAAPGGDSTSNCVVIFRHVFILYDSTGKINEQIGLCLDCAALEYLHRKAFIQFIRSYGALFERLKQRLISSGAYFPNKKKLGNVK